MLHQNPRPVEGALSDREWLLSKVAVLLGSWRLVLIGTGTLTAAGVGLTLLLAKPVYSSRMILPLTGDLLGIIHSGVIDAPRIAVSGLPSASTLYSVSVSGPSPEETEAAAKKAFDEIIERSKPTGSQRDRIIRQIDLLETSIRAFGSADQRFDLLGPGSLADLQLKLIDLQSKLAGLSAEDAVLPPTKAVRTDHSNLRAFAATFLASAGLMILMVLLRHSTIGNSRLRRWLLNN